AGTSRFIVEADSDQAVPESNETNNLRAASQTVIIPAKLTLQIPAAEIAENNGHVEALVTRNGNPAAPLTVTLATSDSTELSAPANVIIPAGKLSATFSLAAQPDGVPDRDAVVTVTASASNHISGTAAITVRNSDTPQLVLQFATASVVEGTQAVSIVSHNGPTDLAVDVYLNPIGHNQFILPEFVTIPSGSAAMAFVVTARDDTHVEPEG